MNTPSTIFLALCLLFGTTFARLPTKETLPMGIVDPWERCGGIGTLRQLRIQHCDGRCVFVAGTPYECEMDFYPSGASTALILVVDICIPAGFCWTILEAEIPNSSVQPGFLYTAKYTIVPNDIFAGETLVFKAHLQRAVVRIEEVCVTAEIDVIA